MENKKWKKGDVNPNTGMIFWSYSDRFQTKEGWLSKEAFDRKNDNFKKYQQSEEGKKYSHEYYEKNKERKKLKRKATLKYREEHNPLMLLLATSRNVARKRKHEFNLDIEYMYNLWDNQKGLCYYSKLPMIKSFNKKSPYQVSIDRIDSLKGYVKDNVCLCCLSINYAKNSFTKDELLEFLKAIELCQKKEN